MPNNNSLINLGDLSKPATVLIEKISEAIGGIFKSKQIIRIAKAEAEASMIKAKAERELTEIQDRALNRLIESETIKQQNIEKITFDSIPLIENDSQPEKIENDWISYFFNKAQIVSDNEMQTLWSRILAGETNKPGSYSKRTIDLISTLEKQDAILFTKFCSFKFFANIHFPFIFNTQDDIYLKNGINYPTLSHLDDLGLIKFNDVTGYMYQKQKKIVAIHYFDKTIKLEFQSNENNDLQFGNSTFTKIGQELAPISGAILNEEFINYAISKFNNMNIMATLIS